VLEFFIETSTVERFIPFLRMAPQERSKELTETGILTENEDKSVEGLAIVDRSLPKRNYEIIWFNVVGYSFLYLVGLVGGFIVITGRSKWQTNVFSEC
jgi:hypothetical protein